MLAKFTRNQPTVLELRDQAYREADKIAVRWDVPQGTRYPGQPEEDKELYIEVEPGVWAIWPHDLRDTKPRLRLTAPDPVTGEQGRVAGHLLPDDLLFGMPSSAIPILLALVPVAAMVLLLASVGGPVGYLIGFIVLGCLLAIVSNATTGAWWLGAGCAACMPLLSGKSPLAVLNESGVPGGAPIAVGVALVFIVGLALLFAGKREARVAVGTALFLAITLAISSVVPAFLQPFVLSLPACALPWSWTYWIKRTRSVELSVYGAACNWESSGKGLGHVNVRKSQTLRAAKGYAK
jgi:hypothetical protein